MAAIGSMNILKSISEERESEQAKLQVSLHRLELRTSKLFFYNHTKRCVLIARTHTTLKDTSSKPCNVSGLSVKENAVMKALHRQIGHSIQVYQVKKLSSILNGLFTQLHFFHWTSHAYSLEPHCHLTFSEIVAKR